MHKTLIYIYIYTKIKQSTFLKIYIYPSIFISPFIAVSSNSWFSIWIILEFNLISFIPIIIFFNKYSKESSFKYFIIQAISSSVILLSANRIIINLNYNILISLIINLINLTIFIKIGAAPFHSWFIDIIKNLNWINCLILSTWQKIIPIIILNYIYIIKLNYIIIIISLLVGSIYGLNHQSIRIILRYSSINHISWMLINLIIRELIWILYFISYLLINISLILIFNNLNIYYINELFMINQKSIKFYIFCNLITIRGLPPILGFIIKWISIYFITLNNLLILLTILIIFTILTFFYYTRLTLSFILNYSIITKFRYLNNKFNLNIKTHLIYLINLTLNLWILSIWIY